MRTKRRMGGQAMRAGVLAGTVLVGLVGCSSDGGDPVAAPTSTSSGASGPDRCTAISRLWLQRAGDPDRRPGPVRDEELARLLGQVVDDVPAASQADVRALRSFVEDSIAEPEDAADTPAVTAAIDGFERLTPWAAEQCPPKDPVWACANTRRKFQPVGEAITADGSAPPADDFATAEAVAVDHAADGDRVVLDEGDDVVWFGWVQDDGLVHEQLEVTRTEGEGWRVSDDEECAPTGGGAGEAEQFETVGESISSGD